jgi:hypothetical protein
MSDARRAKTSKTSKASNPSKTSNNLSPAPAGGKRRLAAALTLTCLTALMLTPAAAQPAAAKEHEAPSRPHVYLLRGLMNIFSLGMDQLAAKIAQRGIAASVHNHAEADAIVAKIAAQYRGGDRGPVILIGHSLGADAVMTMAQALNRDGVPVALVIPFDGTGSYVTPKNVACVLNLTQRNYVAAPASAASSRTSMSAATAALTISRSTSRRGCKRRRSIPCCKRQSPAPAGPASAIPPRPSPRNNRRHRRPRRCGPASRADAHLGDWPDLVRLMRADPAYAAPCALCVLAFTA